jgi:hypothetical protein
MAQAVERWSARAIWVISRADELYPRRWKERLKEDCPPILYGCGRAEILSRRGLAVVGSRDADDDTLAWARQAGKIAASVRVSVVSGERGASTTPRCGAALKTEDSPRSCSPIPSKRKRSRGRTDRRS